MERYWGVWVGTAWVGGVGTGIALSEGSFARFRLLGVSELESINSVRRRFRKGEGFGALRLCGWVGGACTGLGWEFGRFRFGTQINTGFSFKWAWWSSSIRDGTG